LEVKTVLTVKSEEKRRGKMTREEAGRIGGQKVARERGSEFYREIGRKGGEKVAEQRGSEFFREIGKKGGESRGNKSA
jgi:general stress protein YciG